MAVGSVNAQQGADGVTVLTNRADSVAYAFGASVARDLKRTGLETINADVLAKAIADIFAGKQSPLEEAQERELIMQAISAAREKLDSGKNHEEHAIQGGKKRTGE